MSCYTTFYIVSTEDFEKLQANDDMSISEVESGIELMSISSSDDLTALVRGMYKFDCYTEIQKNDWDKIYCNYVELRDRLKDYLKKCEVIYSLLTSREELEEVYDEIEDVKKKLATLESYADRLGMVFKILEYIRWEKSNYTIVAYDN